MLTIKGEILKNVDYQTVLSPIDFFNNIYIYIYIYFILWMSVGPETIWLQTIKLQIIKNKLIHEIN